MSHLLHDYIATQLGRHLRDRRVVVWYDRRSEFRPFVRECAGAEITDAEVEIDGLSTTLASYDGSLFELRERVEEMVAVDEPQPLLIYCPGLDSTDESPLMELELGGRRWRQPLRKLARNALQSRFTDGVIDDLLRSDNVGYDDIAAAVASEGDGAPSVLKTILGGSTGEAQLANWLATEGHDAEIEEKDARVELAQLVRSRLALDLDAADELGKWRSIVARYVLGLEFRSDLDAEPPATLAHISATKDVEQRCRTIASTLRTAHADRYPALADAAESELNLSAASIDPLALGSIDTFRFEERALLARCGELVRNGEYGVVEQTVAGRRQSYWLANDVERQAQWEAIQLAARLGALSDEIEEHLEKRPMTPAGWVEAYADRWHQLDRAQRKFEAWLAKLTDDPDERAVVAVRRRYEDVIDKLATGFVAELDAASWDLGGIRTQTSIFDDLVKPDAGPVAYFMVDAMRYEMGAELAERLEDHGEVTIEPAVGVLPSITTTGMAALMPDAASSFDLIDNGGKLAVRVDGSPLKDRPGRTKHIEARVPSSKDFDLPGILALSSTKLAKEVAGKDLVVVRSVDIDAIGEAGSHLARNVMDTVIDNLVQAVRKLAKVGVARAVIASDHGHLYAAEDRDDSMKITAPGGDTIELHRRCWAGRGGETPPACIRVPARSLGNDSDFDLVFPTGTGVFKSGGDLAFHHGGPSLQEVVIPVLTFRSAMTEETGRGKPELALSDVPSAITNRMFSVKVSYQSLLGTGSPLQPVLVSEGRQVGTLGLVFGGESHGDDQVILEQGSEASLGFMLDDDSVTTLRIQILDPATAAVIHESPEIPVQLGVG